MRIPSPGDGDSFPRRNARTARFTAGAPRAFVPSGDGERVAFLRSRSGTDRATALWVLDVQAGQERLVADPAALLAGGGEHLTAEERSRRERMREGGAGITAYSVDHEGRTVAFALSSRLFVADLTLLGDAAGTAGVRELPAAGPVVDPRVSPDGRHVAYVAERGLHVVGTDGTAARSLAEPEGPQVSYGLADFAAAEELGRHRGFWWGPGSDRVLVARVDVSPVQVWHIGDLENPGRPPAEHRYPAAGTANAEVSLWLLPAGPSAGEGVRVEWDAVEYPYVAGVHWSAAGQPLVQVLTRRQERALVLGVDPLTGATATVRELTDPCWVDVVPGTPAWTEAGELLTVEVVDDRYALCVDGAPVSPEGIHVRRVLPAGARVLVQCTEGLGEDHVHEWSRDDGWVRVSYGPGAHSAVAGPGLLVLATSEVGTPRTTYRVTSRSGGGTEVLSHAEDPGLRPRPEVSRVGARGIPTAVLMPTGWQSGGDRLPVLLDPYGGPHLSRATTAARAYLESQWWADQGFCVIVADGRGTPGTPSWERSVRLDLATPALEDQVAALHAVAEAWPGTLDLGRVAIRGWSFGGFLAALAVLRRPDVFHAAVAGAPVTDWLLYDTAYTERYLGLPDEHPEAYASGSLVGDAASLSRPLMVIHGLADDNVVAAHSLRLSSALLAAGRPHTFLPLSGVTHMTPQEVVAENLLLLQLDFLRTSLGPVSLSGAQGGR